MRKFEFDCDKYENVKGKIVLGIPKYTQRLKIIKDCQFSVDENGQIKAGMDSIDSIVRMVESCRDFFLEVDCEVEGNKLKSLDDLEDYSECDLLISEACSSIMNAGSLGK